MRVLLTGHDGYIGAVMGPWLQAAGHEVAGLDSFFFEGCDFGVRRSAVPGLLRDVSDLEASDLEGFDAVIHLAGLSNDILGNIDPELTYQINYRASVSLARLAKEAGVSRLLFSSSCSMYGTMGDDLLSEDAPTNPLTPYAVSKVKTEKELSKLADKHFSPTYLRNGTVYGLSPKLRADLVVNNLVGYAVTTGEVLMQSDGTPWRPLVHVEDVCRAFTAVLEAPRGKVHNEAFNVGRAEDNYQIRDIARVVQDVVPRSEISFASGASADSRCYRVDFTKLARTLPQFRPQWTLRGGVEDLYRAYREHGLTREEFLGTKYIRIERIKELLAQRRLDSGLRWRSSRPTARAGSHVAFESRSTCRSCESTALTEVLSLGKPPLTAAFLTENQLNEAEPRFPLTLVFCGDCSLLQIRETVSAKMIFCRDYPYYSSFSETLLEHSRQNAIELIRDRGLGPDSLVVEVASNDGYLLKNFVEAGVPVLGIDPADGPAGVAEKRGIPTLRAFFDREFAAAIRDQGKRADVLIANNVLAHVPDLNGFVRGIHTILKEDGIAVLEVPYVRDLIERCEFDTIYHEHQSYFAVTPLVTLFQRHGLSLNRVEHLPIHGGSLRIYVGHDRAPDGSVQEYLREEAKRGLSDLGSYRDFAAEAGKIRSELVGLLGKLKATGKRVAAYGAAAKGVILLTYAGIDSSVIDFVVDRNTHKQGRYMPGVKLPVKETEELLARMPDYVLLLAWNFKEEILRQQTAYLRRGGRFIEPIPYPRIIE